MHGPAAEKRVGVARAKRRDLSRGELDAARARARAAVTLAGLASAAVRLTPLAVSDLTQTYRVRAPGTAAILKIMSPVAAAATLEAQTLLGTRGIALPAVRWADADQGAILYEDVGSDGIAAAPNREALAGVVTYLARLHAAGLVDPADAADTIPAIAKRGWPTPAWFAGRLLTQVRADTPSARRSLLDLVGTLAGWIGERPRIIVGDIKREHFRRCGTTIMLTDLELVSAWDVIPSNLATLLHFPGQFRPAIDEPLRRWLLERYAEEHDRLEGTKTRVEELDHAVRCAETLIKISLGRVAEMDPQAGTHRIEDSSVMVRSRGLFTAASGLLSLEHEIGPDLFARLRSRLSEPRSRRILDVGYGDGEALAQIVQHWPRHHVVGLDRFTGAWRGRRVLGDAQALPIRAESIDVVCGVQVLQYLPDKLACLADVYRVLAPGGFAVFAMTEHFADGSAFVPSLAELIRSWRPKGAIQMIAERRLGSRRVLTFAMTKGRSRLSGVQCLAGVHPSDQTGDPFPYFQSVYSGRGSVSKPTASDQSPGFKTGPAWKSGSPTRRPKPPLS